MDVVRAFAPATVANVGCGFDIFGFALDTPGDEVAARRTKAPGVHITQIIGDGGRLPTHPTKNTASIAVQEFLTSQGISWGVAIELKKNLPLGSGLGSSAASAVAAVVAANELAGRPLARKELLPFILAGEHAACGTAHADNGAPSLLGGFVLIRGYQPLDIVSLPVPSWLHCVVLHPHFELRTADSRAVLKPQVTLSDAVAHSGNTAGFVAALLLEDEELLRRSCQDKLAEPYRKSLIPGFEDIHTAALDAGALGCGISGSGPSIFALVSSAARAQEVARAMHTASLQYHQGADVIVSSINAKGAYIRERE